jgi:hypothetical protein
MATQHAWTVIAAKPTPAAIAAALAAKLIELLKDCEDSKAIKIEHLLAFLAEVGTTLEGGVNIGRIVQVLNALINNAFEFRTVAYLLPAGVYTLTPDTLAKLAELGITHIVATNTTPLPAPVVKKSSDGASSGPAIGSAKKLVFKKFTVFPGTFDFLMVVKGQGSKKKGFKGFKDEYHEYETFTVPINPTDTTVVKMVMTIVHAMKTISKKYDGEDLSTINFGNSKLVEKGTENLKKPDLAKIFALVEIEEVLMLLPVCMEMISRNREKINEGLSPEELVGLIAAREFTREPVRDCTLGEFCHNSLCDGNHNKEMVRTEIDGYGLSAVGCIRASCIRASRLRDETPNGEILPLNDLVGVKNFPANLKGSFELHGVPLRIASN